MDNFGELPFGEIPEPLKYVRNFQTTTLSNGIRVATERRGGETATVSVYMGSGSRHETYENQSAAFITSKMIERGSNSLSYNDVNQRIEDLGARGFRTNEREYTSHGLTSFKKDVPQTLALLGDVICNTAFQPEEFEVVIDSVEALHEGSTKDQKQVLMENVHYNVFRDHMMGQPIRGDRDTLRNLTLDQVRDFHKNHYFGDNVVIVAVGDLDHQQVVDLAEQHFSSLPKTSAVEKTGQEKAVYNPGLLMIRDDEMVNANTGVFFDAPGIKDPEHYSFLLLQHMMGSYRIDKNAEHLNDVHKQYNGMQSLLGNLVDVTMQDSHYLAYSDGGILGNYFFGNEIFVRQMNYCGVHVLSTYAHFMTDVEVFRGRNHLYNTLLNEKDQRTTVDEIGQQIFHLGRRVPRSEVAKRVAHIDSAHIKKLANEWFYDSEPSFTNWGPIELVSSIGSYKYFKLNTMVTITNAHHTLYF